MIDPKIVAVIGRVLIAALFVISGVEKIMGPGYTTGYMASMGVPGLLIWPTILIEIGGGLALAAGFQVRYVAPALAMFTIVAAIIFHLKLSDPIQQLMFLKDFAVAGGLMLAATIEMVARPDRKPRVGQSSR